MIVLDRSIAAVYRIFRVWLDNCQRHQQVMTLLSYGFILKITKKS